MFAAPADFNLHKFCDEAQLSENLLIFRVIIVTRNEKRHMMTDLQSIRLTYIGWGCVKVELFTDEADHYIRVWKRHLSPLHSFVEGATENLTFSECIYDVDGHYNDFSIRRLPTGVRVTFSDYSDISDDIDESIEVTETEGIAFVNRIIKMLEETE